MNTNSKHYEELNIQPWEILERNFTTEEFVAYLKGNIIKYTLRNKGQALTDAQKIKHYAEKLIEVLETKENGGIGNGELLEPVYTPKAEPKEPEVKHKIKVGDRVLVKPKIERTRMKGTIIRTPVDNKEVFCNDNYVIELDSAYNGWKANLENELVESDNAWYADDSELELLLEAELKKTLEPNKWYDAEDLTVEELKELLPVGTKVIITFKHDNDRSVELNNEPIKEEIVEAVTRRNFTKETRLGLENSIMLRRYFKIVEEN